MFVELNHRSTVKSFVLRSAALSTIVPYWPFAVNVAAWPKRPVV